MYNSSIIWYIFKGVEKIKGKLPKKFWEYEVQYQPVAKEEVPLKPGERSTRSSGKLSKSIHKTQRRGTSLTTTLASVA